MLVLVPRSVTKRESPRRVGFSWGQKAHLVETMESSNGPWLGLQMPGQDAGSQNPTEPTVTSFCLESKRLQLSARDLRVHRVLSKWQAHNLGFWTLRGL